MKKNGQQIAKENVATLSAWLAAHKTELPMLPDGALNKSAIARAAGLDKQIFVSNPAAKGVASTIWFGSHGHEARLPNFCRGLNF